MKLRSALLLVVAATVCALSGLISPQQAAASIDAVNNWPATPTIVSNTAGVYLDAAGRGGGAFATSRAIVGASGGSSRPPRRSTFAAAH